MTPEQLLRPRYKVIADYPCRPHPIGSIIEWCGDPHETKTLFTLPGSQHNYPEFKFKEYPNLFRKLEWWEERKPEDMPNYVRSIKQEYWHGINVDNVIAVKEWVLLLNIPYIIQSDTEEYHPSNFLPANESEYTASILAHD